MSNPGMNPVQSMPWDRAVDSPRPPHPSLARRKTLYLGDYAIRVLGGAGNASAALERMARRYDQMLRALLPIWSMGEWAIVTLALRGWSGIADTDAWRAVMGWGHIYNSAAQSIYEIDPVDLAERLREAGPAANAAVLEIVDRYWDLPESLRHAERIERLGLLDREAIKAWDRAQRRRDAAIDQLRKEAAVGH